MRVCALTRFLMRRLSPFIPFNVANYMFGLTAVELWPYLGFTLLGMLPYTFIFVYMGAATRATMMAIQGGHAHADDASKYDGLIAIS